MNSVLLNVKIDKIERIKDDFLVYYNKTEVERVVLQDLKIHIEYLEKRLENAKKLLTTIKKVKK